MHHASAENRNYECGVICTKHSFILWKSAYETFTKWFPHQPTNIYFQCREKITHTQFLHTNHSRQICQRHHMSVEIRNIGKLNAYHSIRRSDRRIFCIRWYVFQFFFSSLFGQVMSMAFQLYWRPLVEFSRTCMPETFFVAIWFVHGHVRLFYAYWSLCFVFCLFAHGSLAISIELILRKRIQIRKKHTAPGAQRSHVCQHN